MSVRCCNGIVAAHHSRVLRPRYRNIIRMIDIVMLYLPLRARHCYSVYVMLLKYKVLVANHYGYLSELLHWIMNELGQCKVLLRDCWLLRFSAENYVEPERQHPHFTNVPVKECITEVIEWYSTYHRKAVRFYTRKNMSPIPTLKNRSCRNVDLGHFPRVSSVIADRFQAASIER